MAVSTNPTLIAQLQGRKFGSHDVLRFLNFFCCLIIIIIIIIITLFMCQL